MLEIGPARQDSLCPRLPPGANSLIDHMPFSPSQQGQQLAPPYPGRRGQLFQCHADGASCSHVARLRLSLPLTLPSQVRPVRLPHLNSGR